MYVPLEDGIAGIQLKITLYNADIPFEKDLVFQVSEMRTTRSALHKSGKVIEVM